VRTRPPRTLAIAGLLDLLVSACGSGDDDASPEAASGSAYDSVLSARTVIDEIVPRLADVLAE
jgi:hypothetical protein